MFTEVELKYEVNDFEEIREKLLLAGAGLLCDATEEQNTVYDLQNGSLKRTNTLLRLRKFGEEIILTVKEPVSSGAMKIRKEHETLLSISLEEAADMLQALNYKPVYRYEKTREMWSLGSGVHICLDSLYFGKFIEIEADTQLKVSSAFKILGLDISKGLRQSYKQLQKISGFSDS